MTRLPLLVLTAAILSACQARPADQGAQGEVTPTTDPLVLAAQRVIDEDLQGRACTTITRSSYPDAFKGVSGFRKLEVLARHGVATQSRQPLAGGEVTAFDLKDLSGTAQGTFIDANIESKPVRLYCYGKWTVTSVSDTDKVKVAGKRVLLAQVKLTDAVPWVVSDPAAAVLTEATEGLSRDPAFLATLDGKDKTVAASVVNPNTVLVAIPEG